MLTHLFFDVGSTLVDESRCEKARFEAALSQPGSPPREVFEECVRRHILGSGTPIKSAAAEFGLSLPPWDSSLETVFPEAPGVLERLSKRYALGVIANQSAGCEKRLRERGIGKFFRTFTLSAEAGVAKPDPEIFLIALREAGCAPENACMIGDRPDNDIAPAACLGMTTVWVRRGLCAGVDPALAGAEPDFVVDSLQGVERVLMD